MLFKGGFQERSNTGESEAGDNRNRRTAERLEVFEFARIISPDGKVVIPCIVRDQSEGGALLEVEDSRKVGEIFILAIDGDKFHRPVEVRWRNEFELGVMFVKPKPKEEEAENWSYPLPVNPERVFGKRNLT